MQGGDKSAIGAEAEARFVIKCLQSGWQVAKPVQDGRGYDFVFNRGDGWFSVQVKQAYQDKGNLSVNLRRSNGSVTKPYVDGDFDYLFASHDGHRQWLIPWTEIRGKRSVICVEAKKYKQFNL